MGKIHTNTVFELIKKREPKDLNPLFEFGSWCFTFRTIGGDPVNGVSFTKHGMRKKQAISQILRDFPGSTFDVAHAHIGLGMGAIPFKDIATVR